MNGATMIADERQRQIEEEGWSPEHDAEHTGFCLATAGAAYALHVASVHSDYHQSHKTRYAKRAMENWPFDLDYFKPTSNDPVRQLVKAGALIAAEIDRLIANNANSQEALDLCSFCNQPKSKHEPLCIHYR